MTNTMNIELAPASYGVSELDSNELTTTQGGEPVSLTVLALWVGGGLLLAGAGYLVGKYVL